MEECLCYFKKRPVFHKLFLKIRDKYQGLGHLGGSVLLTGLSPEEKTELGGFFQKDFQRNRSVTISYETMKKALLESRFSELCWEDILTCYFGTQLMSKKEEREKKERELAEFLQKLKNRYDGFMTGNAEHSWDWVLSLFQKTGVCHQSVLKRYKENKEDLVFIMDQVLLAGKNLPVYKNRVETMAVFSAKITGNPHFFDEGTLEEKLLSSYLDFFFRGEEDQELSRTEQKGKQLYQAGIMKDDLSNFVLVYNLHGRKKDGQLHEGLEGFAKEKEPVQLTLMTLGDLRDVWAETDKVYVVENPSVFSYLCKKYPDGSFLCGNGQIRLAVWVLMDFLCSHHEFCYGGDFDPEGLLIAQKLKVRYRDKLSFWGYEERYFEKYLSDVVISEKRLKKLDKVWIEELQEVKTMLRKKKRAVYQEAMMEEYWRYL